MSITTVLTLYKRLYTLIEQLETVQLETVQIESFSYTKVII